MNADPASRLSVYDPADAIFTAVAMLCANGAADDDTTEILRTMASHKVRRFPVIDGHRLVGVIALADVARSLPDPQVGDLLEALSAN